MCVKKWRSGFTLIELLVVIGIISALLGVMLPALGGARQSARNVQCLSNMRSLEVAHWNYVMDNDGRLVDVGLGAGHDESVAWINTLDEYYASALHARSPVDDSSYWPGGHDATATTFRRTSYGINDFLAMSSGASRPVSRIEAVVSPSATIHFLYMSESDEDYAIADHPHIESWGGLNPDPKKVLDKASQQLELHAHGGPPGTWDSLANYGFLDGHAETRKFGEVYENGLMNQFDPAVAR